MKFTIALLHGDGIGPEIVDSAVRVLEKVGKKHSHSFEFIPYLAGGIAIDTLGEPLPQATIDGCLAADSVLLGAVGGKKWESLPGDMRPERALLGLRFELGLYTNLRPAKLYSVLGDACPLRRDIVEKGIDLLMVRELTGGIYFGDSGRRSGKFGEEAFDTECYGVEEIERIARSAFGCAEKRRKKITSIDKANVLESSRLWRETIHRVAQEYPDVVCEDMLVDNAAMQLIRNPSQFDVIVTSNLFGDILSDEASQLTGSIGLLPSASLGNGSLGMYEPIHGSAPDIAGLGIANPIATILSAAMMLRFSFGLEEEAVCIENAVEAALNRGCRTADMSASSPASPLHTAEMTDEILKEIK